MKQNEIIKKKVNKFEVKKIQLEINKGNFVYRRHM